MNIAKIFISILFMVSMASGFLFMNCAKPLSKISNGSGPTGSEKINFAPGVMAPTKLRIKTTAGGLLDTGRNSAGFNIKLPGGVVTSYDVSGCTADANGQIENCNLSGPTLDPTIVNPLSLESTHRCTKLPSKVCNLDTDCGNFGVCRFYVGGPIGRTVGGVTTCSLSYFSQDHTGSFNVKTGSGLISSMPVHTDIFQKEATTGFCPLCSGTTFRCTGGAKIGGACAVHAYNFKTDGTPVESGTSLDCPPSDTNPFSPIAYLESDLGPIGTGIQTLTTTSNSPTVGVKKVFSGICNDSNEPCLNSSTCGFGACIMPASYANECFGSANQCNFPSPSSIAKRPVGMCPSAQGSGNDVTCVLGYTGNIGNSLSVEGTMQAPVGGVANVVFGSVFPVGVADGSNPSSIINALGLPGPGRIYQPATVTLYTPPAPQYLLTITPSSGTGSGTISSSPNLISCTTNGQACSTTLTSGTVVTLYPQPAPGSEFNGWTGDCSSFGTQPCPLTVISAVNVGFSFRLPAPPATLCPIQARTCNPGNPVGGNFSAYNIGSTGFTEKSYRLRIVPANPSNPFVTNDLVGADFVTSTQNHISLCIYHNESLLLETQVTGGLQSDNLKNLWTQKSDKLQLTATRTPYGGISKIKASAKNIDIRGSGPEVVFREPMPLSGGTIKAQFVTTKGTEESCWETNLKIDLSFSDYVTARP